MDKAPRDDRQPDTEGDLWALMSPVPRLLIIKTSRIPTSARQMVRVAPFAAHQRLIGVPYTDRLARDPDGGRDGLLDTHSSRWNAVLDARRRTVPTEGNNLPVRRQAPNHRCIRHLRGGGGS